MSDSRKKNVDPSELTDDESIWDLLMQAMDRMVSPDKCKGKTRFTAVVLEEPKGIDAPMFESVGTKPSTPRGQFKFRAQIIDKPCDPHAIYNNVLDPDLAPDKNASLEHIVQYTEFYSTESSSHTMPSKGDKVLVDLRFNVHSYNLVSGEYVGPVETSGYSSKNNRGTSARGAFSGGTAEWGPTSRSTPAYPECQSATHGMVKKKTKISTVELMKIARKQTKNYSLAVSVVAMAITEQPEAGNMVGGFNYNHWGVMADHGKTWGSVGRKYIKCAVPSTEGVGGSGDRSEKIRYFAAFASEEEAVSFMIEKISGRSDVDDLGNTLAFASLRDGVSWAKLHTLQWLSPTGKEEIIKNTSKMNRKAKNWDKALMAYAKAVGETTG